MSAFKRSLQLQLQLQLLLRRLLFSFQTTSLPSKQQKRKHVIGSMLGRRGRHVMPKLS
jgi:hypothetical protein